MTALLALWAGLAKVLGAVWSWARKHPVATPWLIVVVLAALLVAQHWDGVRRAADLVRHLRAVAEARSEEEARHRQEGMAVVQVAAQAKVEQALAQVKDLQAAVDAAQAEVGRLTVKYVIHAEASGKTRAVPPRPGEPARLVETVSSAEDALPPVQLREGDGLRLVLDSAIVSGRRGAESVHGFQEAIRESDGASLLRVPFDVPVTVALESSKAVCAEAAPARKWRAGPIGGMTTRGWEIGGAYTRKVNVFGYEPETLVLGRGGPDRAGGVQAGVAVGVLF